MQLLWHASPHTFDRPRLAQRVVHEDRHQNGALGIWTATEPADYLKGFGANLYRFTLISKARLVKVPLEQLAKGLRETDPDRLAKIHQQWRETADAFAIVELSGRVDQVLILDDRTIATCERVPWPTGAPMEATPVR